MDDGVADKPFPPASSPRRRANALATRKQVGQETQDDIAGAGTIGHARSAAAQAAQKPSLAQYGQRPGKTFVWDDVERFLTLVRTENRKGMHRYKENRSV